MKTNILIWVLFLMIKASKCQLTFDSGTQYSTDIFQYTDDSTYTSQTESNKPTLNYCVELGPYCSCFLSPLKIKCDNFSSFDQLSFTPLLTNAKPKKINELELSPLNPLILDSTLDLTGIELYSDVILRNLKGFELKSNPFDSVRNSALLNLYLYESKLDLYENSKTETRLNCIGSINTPISNPVFSAFNLISTNEVSVTNKICPIAFKNVNLRSLTFNYIEEDSLAFDDADGFDSLNSSISTLRIFSSTNFKLNAQILNKFVFENLKTLDLDYVVLKKIDDDIFSHFYKLKTIQIVTENFKEFIQSSSNTWMKSLNGKINVDLNDNLEVQDNKNQSMLVTINNRNSGQSYLYPDEDLVYFQNWPHEKMVFLRILTDQYLNCSKTLKFLLKYAQNYPTPSSLSTTSTEACFKTEPITSTSLPQPVNYCPELHPYCSCFLSPLFIKCDNFDSFDQLNFKLLLNETRPREISELELSPSNPIILDHTLDLTGIALYKDVKLRNLKGFELESNPFDSVRNSALLNLYLYSSKLDIYEDAKTLTQLDCLNSASMPDLNPVFSSFNYIMMNEVLLNQNICPTTFKNANLRSLTINNLRGDMFGFDDAEKFDELNCTIATLKIYSSSNFKLDSKLLNKFVFANLKTLDLDYTQLKTIEDDTFSHLNKLKTVLIVIENFKEFIQSSNNAWMKSLNGDVKVNLSDVTQVENKKKDSMLVTINNRNNGQSYLYSDEDQVYFQNWPHEKLAFLRILTDMNLKCSKTLKFLMQYANNYPTPSSLNTTSTESCFYTEVVTTKSSTVAPNPATSTVDYETTTTATSETVSLAAFLGTVIPLAVISFVSLVSALVLFCKFKALKSKIIPSDFAMQKF